MRTHSEEALEGKMLAGIEDASANGAQVLGVSLESEPAAITDAIDSFVFAWQGGDRPPKRVVDAEDAPFALGALWGQQLVRQFGWEWRTITFHEHGDTKAPGVLAPDRALAVYPIHFILGCLQDSGVDATIMLSFNMLLAGNVGETTPGEYCNLMDGVHRIIPRIAENKKKSWWSRFRGR